MGVAPFSVFRSPWIASPTAHSALPPKIQGHELRRDDLARACFFLKRSKMQLKHVVSGDVFFDFTLHLTQLRKPLLQTCKVSQIGAN